ncbi:phage holin [Carnobacteriaceae bacterium 52-44]
MKLNNKIYDVGKWVVFIFLPALAVFISGLGELYGWGNTQTIVTTINLVNVFIGSILQLSSSQYHKKPGGRTGETKSSRHR